MRDIKFRAWIYGLGKMMPVKEIDFDDFMPSVMVEINSERHEQMFFENTDYPDCELLQYTGLKDKNGKEIYEGDIITTDLERPYLIVEYRNGAFMLNCNDGLEDYYDIFFGTSEEPKEVYKYGEVIGNIYENPELLEVEE